MKQLYICDKCGATFDSWDDAYNCENSHIDTFTDELEPERVKRFTYAQGQAAPRSIIQAVKAETWVESEQKYKVDFPFYKYKYAGTLSEQEAAEIVAEYEARKAEEDRRYAEWKAKWDAERKAKEQEPETKSDSESA